MNLHPDREKLLKRLRKIGSQLISRHSGAVFRFLDPKFSKVTDQFKGRGAAFADGRWALKGDHLIAYTSLLPETALSEAFAANRYYGFPDDKQGHLLFVTAHAKLKKVIDLCEGDNRKRLRFAERTIIDTDWRADNSAYQESITQAWGWAFLEWGVEGIICPSSAHTEGRNLIVFPHNLLSHSHLEPKNEVVWPVH